MYLFRPPKVEGALRLQLLTKVFASTLLMVTPAYIYADADTADEMEEVIVWGDSQDRTQAGYTNPTSLLQREDFASINIATTEDLVKYEPSLVIRRRYIGDANGVMGIRGANMFQTSRSMVFADGVPLHYLLQSRWNGAPRWTLVSASEIAQVETIYGPYSAEFSGNALGGVVQIETAIPQEREFHFDSAYFSQQFDDYGFDDTINGYKTFLSYGDRFGSASLYLSYNHLDNDSQPQTFYTGGSSSSSTPTSVTGALPGVDSRSRPSQYFGDTGIVETETNNYKLKFGYDFERWSTLLNVAYENRMSVADSANSYVRDTSGHLLWSGDVLQDSVQFSIPSSRLNVDEHDRDSLSVGLRVRGALSDSIDVEANVSHFAILHDEDRSSARNPADPAYTTSGEVTQFDDTGWNTAEVKLHLRDFNLTGLSLSAGVRYEAYELNFDVYDSNDWASGRRSDLTASSGGETDILAFYLQSSWDINEHWDLSLGGRYERFHSKGGYFADDDVATPALDIANTESTRKNHFSPKFSIGFKPAGELWQFRYSLARAYRFPIVEELFSQYRAFNAVSVSNPELEPEDATAHNFMMDREISGGYLRLNFFQQNVENTIESQSTTLPGGISIRTFVPIDKVRTRGVEFIAHQQGLWSENLDVRFNITYTDSEILRNKVDTSIEGNRYPRMPKWRGNLLATYHLTDNWDMGASIQYASDSFGRNDNTDEANRVYGAQDRYTRVGLKTTWRINEALSVGLGVDNLTNEISYVAHPWPGRTWFGNLSYDW